MILKLLLNFYSKNFYVERSTNQEDVKVINKVPGNNK
jgi:hypothetical protein